MYNVRLTKIKNNHDRLRDNVIEGQAAKLPAKGSQFWLTAPPRDDPNASGRVVNTSVVTRITTVGNQYILNTESGSVYQVDNLGEVNGIKS